MELENYKKCPLCGNPITDSHDFCDACRDEAKSRDIMFRSEGIEEHSVNETDGSCDNTDNQPPDSYNKKKGRKTLIFFFTLCAIVLALGLGNTLWVRHYQNTVKETENVFWDECAKVNTPLEYSKYLVRFPEGIYAEEAQKRIKELRDKEQNDWQKTKASNEMVTIYEFLGQYPNSPYIEEAKDLMDSLCWDNAMKSGKAEAYNVYLENYNMGFINGLHLADAQGRYNYLNSIVNIEGSEADSVKSIITNFFNAVSSLKAYDIALSSTFEISPFLGHLKAHAGSIIQLIANEKKSKKINTLQYVALLDSASITKDSANVYFVDAPLIIELKFNDKKKAGTSDTIMTSIELDDEMKIKSIFLKE